MNGHLGKLLLPDSPRYLRGERWINIVLRAAHLVGIAGIGGGFLFAQDPALWEPYWYLSIVTGIALVALYLWSTFAWVFELKGLAVLVKTLMLGGAFAWPAARAELFVTIVILSGVMAHAPARVRGYRWLQVGGARHPF
jgi:hypothetical protein